MGAYIGEVRSVLRDVALEGAVVIGKKKLFWLLGWRQDRAGAWQALLDAWEANDEDRSTLKGSEVGDKIVRKTRRTVLQLPGVPDFAQPITVKYGDQLIPADVEKGWSYDGDLKKIVISGAADIKTRPGVEVTVTATYINLANEGTKRVVRKGKTGGTAATLPGPAASPAPAPNGAAAASVGSN